MLGSQTSHLSTLVPPRNEVKLNSWCDNNCYPVAKHIFTDQTNNWIIELQPTEKSKRRLMVVWHPIRFYADADFNYFSPSAQTSIKLSPWGICTPWELCGTLVVKSPHTAFFNEPLVLRYMFLLLKARLVSSPSWVWRCVVPFPPCSVPRRAPAPWRSGGRLITQVWGLVTGRHHPALCCCQESFTASNSLPNGASESIKTIITANPAQSREIILACWSKHGSGIWVYLSADLLDMQSAGQAIPIWILRLCLVWMDGWLQQGFVLFFLTVLSQSLPVQVGNRNPSLWVLDGVKALINHRVFPPTIA